MRSLTLIVVERWATARGVRQKEDDEVNAQRKITRRGAAANLSYVERGQGYESREPIVFSGWVVCLGTAGTGAEAEWGLGGGAGSDDLVYLYRVFCGAGSPKSPGEGAAAASFRRTRRCGLMCSLTPLHSIAVPHRNAQTNVSLQCKLDARDNASLALTTVETRRGRRRRRPAAGCLDRNTPGGPEVTSAYLRVRRVTVARVPAAAPGSVQSSAPPPAVLPRPSAACSPRD